MSPPGEANIEGLAARIDALTAVARLREADGPATYLVGGTVRDLLLGAERVDLDVAVEGDLAELMDRLGSEGQTHERFETASLVVQGVRVDLARTRAEAYERPGALPDVRPASLADDLARRDFTVNAMAVPLSGEPELIDPHEGAADLEAGLLRILHEHSFVDDPTRALRAARYAARLGFELEQRTAELARSADLSTVSEDRVDAELLRLAGEPTARRGFELLSEWGLVPLADGAGSEIDALAELIGREPWSQLVGRREAVLAAARAADGDISELAVARPGRPSEAVELADGMDGISLALARVRGAEWLDDYVAEWRNVELEITGEDLLEAGVPEGPAVGRGLKAALARKLDGELSGRDEELDAALAAAREDE